MRVVAFFIRHFTERGTEVSAYDYARYNEELLGNKSYIVCFTPEKQRQMQFQGFFLERHSFQKFSDRFEIIELSDLSDMPRVIADYQIDFFYTQTYGGPNDVYEFSDRNRWTCKTIKHGVFDTRAPEGADYYISISSWLNERFGTDVPVIPYIVNVPQHGQDMREELGIPTDALVLGRHGGSGQFSIPMVHGAIREILEQDENLYFLFLNTNTFCTHPRIIYLPRSVDLDYKTKFINTCDGMIHARIEGETFGLAVAEFSCLNKPVITCASGDLEHVKILGDRAILYDPDRQESLIKIFREFRSIRDSRADWNAYRAYSPAAVMSLFDNLIFSR
jgi:hypothetical protein